MCTVITELKKGSTVEFSKLVIFSKIKTSFVEPIQFSIGTNMDRPDS